MNMHVMNLVWFQRNCFIKISELKITKQTWIRWVSFIICSLIIWCNKLLFSIVLNSLFTDSLHFLSVFTHRLVQSFFNVMNRIKIINQMWLGLTATKWISIQFFALIQSKFLDKKEGTDNVVIECLWIHLFNHDHKK